MKNTETTYAPSRSESLATMRPAESLTATARRKYESSTQPTAVPGDIMENGAGIRVLCVDDHAMLIEGLKAQFSLHDNDGKAGGPIRCVEALSSADGMLDAVARLKPDVVLLDIEMPGPDAFETADRLRHMYPGVRVVFLSAHIRDGYIAAAYKCGAAGYFSKSDSLEDIVSGLREVARAGGSSGNGTFIAGPKVRERCHVTNVPKSAAARKVMRPDSGDGVETETLATPLGSLSGREMEVLRLIGRGMSRTQIAAELSRSVKTVDGHQDRMMKKLGAVSRSDLMRFAIREGLAEA